MSYSDLERRVSELERRVDRMERELSDTVARISSLETKIDTLLEQSEQIVNILKNQLTERNELIELLLKYIILPLIFIVGGLVGIKIAFP